MGVGAAGKQTVSREKHFALRVTPIIEIIEIISAS
jgi:hypothetical protein